MSVAFTVVAAAKSLVPNTLIVSVELALESKNLMYRVPAPPVVLNIVNVSNNFVESKKQALAILQDINWTKGFYRKDIGYKVIS